MGNDLISSGHAGAGIGSGCVSKVLAHRKQAKSERQRGCQQEGREQEPVNWMEASYKVLD